MSPRRRDSPGPTAAASLTDDLRSRILDGDPPPGTPLREEALAQQHGVSRHTVRAALAALAAERLVDFVPYRGARVAQLDDDALVALQQLRAGLEAEAVRILRETHPNPWPDDVTAPIRSALDDLVTAEAGGDWPRTTRAHAAVHRALVAAAASERITQVYTQLDAEVLLLLTHLRPHYAPGAFTQEHRRYLAAVQSDGPDVVRAHLAHSTQIIRSARSGG